MDVKRERGKNYSEAEKENLIEIASAYKHVIENKKTDNVSVRQKEDTWEIITTRWNSISQTGPRKKDQLKMLYCSMKKQARKRAAEDKKEMYKTGNVTFRKNVDELDQRVLDLTEIQSNEVENIYDCNFGEDQHSLLENLPSCSSQQPQMVHAEYAPHASTRKQCEPSTSHLQEQPRNKRKEKQCLKEMDNEKRKIKLEILKIRRDKEEIQKDILLFKKKKLELKIQKLINEQN